MGYDLNKFVDIQQLPNHLKCFICNLILQDPLQSPCEHNFCSQCITIYLEQTTNHCPHFDEDTVSVKSDKKKSPLKKISSFRKIIGKSPKDKLPPLKLSDLKNLPNTVISELNSLKVNCDFHLNGCKEELILSNLSEHVKQCKFINKIELDSEKKMAEQQEKSKQEDLEQQSAELDKESTKDEPKRKDSENKSTNSESKLVSEEEANSDDFVVISKTSATKSTESVQTNNSDPTIISSKENVSKDDEDTSIGDTAVEKKKKKKKKKNKAKTDEDAISQSSLKVVSDDSSKKGSSKESLVDNNTEELKRALKDAETKTDNLRLMNAQLLGQLKKLKEEKEEITKKLGTNEMNALKDKIQRLEKENKSQALKIINLIDSNENLNNFIRTLREDQNQLKEKYSSTLNDVQQTLKIFKTCKQAN